jgi:hypothetical protein
VLTAGKDTLLFRDTALNVAGGNVRVNGQLVNGRWQASGTAAGIQLGQIAQVPRFYNHHWVEDSTYREPRLRLNLGRFQFKVMSAWI